MRSRKFRALTAAVLSASLLAIPTAAFAEDTAEKDEFREETYEGIEITDGEFNFTGYEKEIEVDGVKYEFYSIEYVEDTMEKFKYAPEGEEKVYIETYTDADGNEVETGDEMPKVPETYKDADGNEYGLVSTEWSEKTVVDERTAEVTLFVKRNATTNGDAPLQMEAETYVDPDTGHEQKLPDDMKGQMLDLDEEASTLDAEYWGSGDYSASMTFNHYEYTTFDYNGNIIEKNEEQPLPPEYWQMTLTDQGLDTNLFRVTNIAWSGAAYTDGTTYYRDALITGNIYNREYTDTYKGTVNIPAITYRTVVAMYEETDESFQARHDSSATATAVVTYKRTADDGNDENDGEDGKTPWQKFVEFISSPAGFVTIGIALAAIVIAIILVILAKKKKKKEDDDAGGEQ